MKVKVLYSDKYDVVAVMDGDDCPTEDFLENGEATTQASREGLSIILQHIAENGLNGASWVHEANKQEGIYEFTKGKLRLFFFKGVNNQIAVCTTGVIKKQQKADKPSVNKAIGYKKQYAQAIETNSITVVEDED